MLSTVQYNKQQADALKTTLLRLVVLSFIEAIVAFNSV